jgi:hypothetical protein
MKFQRRAILFDTESLLLIGVRTLGAMENFVL